MKKHSIILLLLAAVLCLSMLLSSCSLFKKNENNDATPPEDDTTPTDVTPDYAAVIGKWNEYLTFTDPTVGTPLKSQSPLFHSTNMLFSNVVVTDLGKFYLRTEFGYADIMHERLTSINYEVYNVATGELIWEDSVENNPDLPNNERYEIRSLGTLPILIVRHTFYEETVPSIFTPVTNTYYYDVNGNLLAKDPTVARTMEGFHPYAAEINDKIYVFNIYGDLLITFEKGKEYPVPEIDLAYGESFYVFEEDGSAYLFNKTYQKVGEYKVPADYGFLEGRYVLNNGNLLYHFTSDVVAPKAEYNYETTYGERCNQNYVIVDAKTGVATPVSLEYKLLSLLSANDSAKTGIGFKGEYQLAVIQKINEKTLSRERVTVILDNELKIVAELPNFIVAQASVVGMKDAETLLINSKTYNEAQELYYAINVTNGTPALYVDVTDTSYQAVDNGFIYDGKLYNNACKPLLELSNYAYEIYDNFIMLKSYGTELITIEKGELVRKTLSESSTNATVHNNIIIVHDNFWSQSNIFNTAGELLLTTNGIAVPCETGKGYSWIVASETYYIFK